MTPEIIAECSQLQSRRALSRRLRGVLASTNRLRSAVARKAVIRKERAVEPATSAPTKPLPSTKSEHQTIKSGDHTQLVRVGVYQKRVKVMLSFRDTVSAALIRGRLDGGQESDWLGHALEGTGPNHFDPPQTIQGKMDVTIPMLDFPVLDLSSIRYQSGWWNDWLKRNMKP